MIAVILIAIAALFIPLATYDLNPSFSISPEKKLANIKNPLRFRILLSIYLKNYFRVGRDNMGLFHIYRKENQYSRIGGYWTKYQSLGVEDFNHARVYLDKLRTEKGLKIKRERKKKLGFPRPRKVYNDLVIY